VAAAQAGQLVLAVYVTDVQFVSFVDEIFGPSWWQQCARNCACRHEEADDVSCCPAAELEGQRWQGVLLDADTSISCMWLVIVFFLNACQFVESADIVNCTTKCKMVCIL